MFNTLETSVRHIHPLMTKTSLIANRMLGGKKGYSVCATVYEDKMNGSRVAHVMVKVIDYIFSHDKQHCRKAYLLRSK